MPTAGSKGYTADQDDLKGSGADATVAWAPRFDAARDGSAPGGRRRVRKRRTDAATTTPTWRTRFPALLRRRRLRRRFPVWVSNATTSTSLAVAGNGADLTTPRSALLPCRTIKKHPVGDGEEADGPRRLCKITAPTRRPDTLLRQPIVDRPQNSWTTTKASRQDAKYFHGPAGEGPPYLGGCLINLGHHDPHEMIEHEPDESHHDDDHDDSADLKLVATASENTGVLSNIREIPRFRIVELASSLIFSMAP